MQAGRKRIQYADSQRQNSKTTALLLAKDKTKLKLGQLETVDENRVPKYEGQRDNEQGHTQTLNTEEEQGKEQTPGKHS